MSEESNNESNNDWRSGLPEDLRDNPSLKDIKDIGGLAKNFVDQQKYLGQSIRIPGEDAGDGDRAAFNEKLMKAAPNLVMLPGEDDPEGQAAFWKRLGRPEDVSGYEVPDDSGLSPELRDRVQQEAADLGLTKAQFKKHLERVQKLYGEQDLVHQENLKGLEEMWGESKNDKLAQIEAHIRQTEGPGELLDAIKKGNVDPAIAQYLYNLVDGVAEPEPGISDPGRPASGRLSPEEAQEKINEMMNNADHPYWNDNMPGHNAAVEKMYVLQKIAGTRRDGRFVDANVDNQVYEY